MFPSQSEFDLSVFRSQGEFSGHSAELSLNYALADFDLPGCEERDPVHPCTAKFSGEFTAFFKGTARTTTSPYQVPESLLRVTSFVDFALGSFVAKVVQDNAQRKELLETHRLPLEIMYIYSKLFPEDLAAHSFIQPRNCLSVADEFSKALNQRWGEIGFTSSQSREMTLKFDRAIELNKVLLDLYGHTPDKSPVSAEFKFAIRCLDSFRSEGSPQPRARDMQQGLQFEIEKVSELAAEQLESIDRGRGSFGGNESSKSLDLLYFSTRPWKDICPVTLDDMGIIRGTTFFLTCANIKQTNPAALVSLLESVAFRIEFREMLSEFKPVIKKLGFISLEVAYRFLRAGIGL